MKTRTKGSGPMQAVTLESAPTEGSIPNPGQVMKILNCGAFIPVLATAKERVGADLLSG